MDLSNDELDYNKVHRNIVRYTKLASTGKGISGEQFKEFYNAYCELYDYFCEYIDIYNEAEKEVAYYVKLLTFIIDDILLNMGLEINEKNEARTIQKYKDELRKAENLHSKVTEQELKDMILGMLE